MGLNKRILVVDDNEEIHKDFKKVLGRVGNDDDIRELESVLFEEAPARQDIYQNVFYDIDSAFQGEEALDMVVQAEAQGRPYAVAFVDIRMPPGWDGIETISKIWEKSPYTEVVICSAYSDYSWDEIIKHLGSTDSLVFLKKPFSTDVVHQLVSVLTKKWWQGHQARMQVHRLKEDVNSRTQKIQSLVRKLGTQGSQPSMIYRLDITESNISYITEIVLQEFIKKLQKEKQKNPRHAFDKILRTTHDQVLTNNDVIVSLVQQACRDAILMEPNLRDREDLFGRILVQCILGSDLPNDRWKSRFEAHFIRPLLVNVREVLGESNYIYFNNVLKETLYNHCVIRDLKHAEIDWNEFFSQHTVTLMLRKTLLVKKWLESSEENRDTFINKMNTFLKDTESLVSFVEGDLEIILQCWDTDRKDKNGNGRQ